MDIRILLVDDDPIDCLAIHREVNHGEYPYQVTEMSDIRSALEAIREMNFDLALVDFNLPDGTGFDLLKKAGGLPCIFITGTDDVTTAVEIMKAGAYDFLVKDKERRYLKLLPTIINKAIDKKHVQQQIDLQTQMVNCIEEMVLVFNKDKNITFANESAIKNLASINNDLLSTDEGLSEEAEKKQPLFSLKEWLLSQAVRETGDNSSDNDIELVNNDGKNFWTSWTVNEVTSNQGIICVGVDITNRRQNEERLRQYQTELEKRVLERTEQLSQFVEKLEEEMTENKLAQEKISYQANLLQNISEAIISTDNLFVIESWNKAAQAIYGWSEREVIGRSLPDLLKGHFSSELTEKIRDGILKAGKWYGEVVFARKDGSTVDIFASVSKVSNYDGEMIGVIFITRDISERKLVEKNLRLLNMELEKRVTDRTAQLEAANRELEAFSYSVSHDLKVPLRAINGFSQILLEDKKNDLDQQTLEYLLKIQQATVRMAHLIDDLLRLSQVTRDEINVQRLDLIQMAKEIINTLTEGQKQRSVKWVLASGIPVSGDPVLMRAVMENLLSNAWKFTSKNENAVIEIGTITGDRQPVIYIRDNGAGFDIKKGQKIFEPFQRMHSQHEFEGTGIGLAIVKRVIQRHHGEIWADSKTGQGTTFFFTLPESKKDE